jgi:hypothetical protein
MKYSVVFILSMLLSPAVISQVKVDGKGKVIEETDRRANEKTDEAIDAGFRQIEEGIGNLFQKKGEKREIKSQRKRG